MRRLLLLVPLPLVAAWVAYSGAAYAPDDLQLQRRAPTVSVERPESAEGFSVRGAVRTYDRDNLYEYVNGHAEFFLSYGFASLAVADYAGAGKGEVTVEWYDMENADNAAAVLKEEKGSARKTDMQGLAAFARKGGLLFAKGRYYVKIGSFGVADDDMLRRFAIDVASAIKDDSKAVRISRLPMEGKVAESDGYVKEDYMGLSFLTDVSTARYLDGDAELEAFEWSAPPDALVEFFEKEKAEIDDTGGHGRFRLIVIRDKYEGTIHMLTDGSVTVGLRGEVSDPFADAFLASATRSLGE